MYRAINLGWGVQSWALAAMVALGELEPVAAAIHSDTTHERSSTYAFAAEWTPWLEAHGVTVVTVRDEHAANIFWQDDNGQTHMPLYTLDSNGSHGQLRRSCTSRWKITPIRRYVQAQRNGQPVEQWLGITSDEWHRAKDSDVQYITHRYPLLEMGMSRADCETWLQRHNLPSPGKSACVFCPYHNMGAWQAAKRAGGDDWQVAVAVDEAIRDKRPGYQSFVCSRRLPLSEAVVVPEDFGMSQLELLASSDADAECDSGFCFL